MNTTIKSLRQSGYKVRVLHDRYVQPLVGKHGKFINLPGSELSHLTEARKNGLDVAPKGGKTIIEVTVPQGSGILPATVTGVAECSLKDNYCKRTGIQVALGRAVKQFTNTESN